MLLPAKERHIIQGIIFEKETEIVLPGAHVLIEGTSFGTISGPDGSFRLSIADFPITLKVTHIGFEDRFFTVTESLKEETLMLGLNFSAEMLEGVTITDKKAELIFKNESYSVLDFEFHENGLMLLIFRNRLKRAELVLLSTMNDTLAILAELPGKAANLHHDCLDNIHYVAKDSAYQVQFTGTGLNLIYPADIRIFRLVARAFAAYHNDNYYFGIRRMHDQVIEYIRYDSIADAYVTFREVYDSKKLGILKENPGHHGLLGSFRNDDLEFALLLMGTSASIDAQIEALDRSRDISIEAHYLKKIVYTPLYAPLFKSGKQMIIFNHPESQIEFLTPYGELEATTPIDYHKKNDWEEMILKDEIRDEYYTVFIHSNRASLHPLNIKTGILGPANILYYLFVKKILVRNGYAYFTYRQPGSIERTMLFRQKLQAGESKYAVSNKK
ncbi:MAG: carboxypeptidase-like regulatory domain-containing protein [Bacteroidales bacterium]|nr:carboxypeptidase-like regulatory domain-containing protein [Bacteroidales bacterium]